jgi:RNA polymerase sigma-70 factor, ECF subfamily
LSPPLSSLLSSGLFEKPGVNDVAERAFRRHYDHVYRYVRRRTRDHDRAEDLTQQVFADAVLGLRESPSPPLAWLYTVARRRFADEARRDTVARRVAALRPVAEESRDYGADVGVALRSAFDRLPSGQREVVVLKLLRGARFAEIGARLGISTEAAKMRFVRALEALRTELEEEGLRP